MQILNRCERNNLRLYMGAQMKSLQEKLNAAAKACEPVLWSLLNDSKCVECDKILTEDDAYGHDCEV